MDGAALKVLYFARATAGSRAVDIVILFDSAWNKDSNAGLIVIVDLNLNFGQNPNWMSIWGF